ncbi:DUF4097 family beta strand repeat-containing protein [Salinifilum aidingensis]
MTDEDPTGPDEPQDAGARADDAGESPGLVRSLDFDTPQPLTLDIGDNHGPVTVELTDTAVTQVEVRHDPDADAPDWRGGLAGLLNWVTEQFGEAGARTGRDPDRGREREPATEAVRNTRVELTGNRLVVRTPSGAPLRNVPVAVRVRAPAHSELSVQAGSGDVTVTGTAVRAQVQSGGGAVSLAGSTERATVRTGSGQLRLGLMKGGVHARSGSGDVEIAGVLAASSVVTGSADVWLGEVGADVLVRSGSGDLSVTDAAAGELELITGSGEIQVALRRGRSAEVDLTSSAGSARSDLDVRDQPPATTPELHVYGRTGTGDVVLTSAL